MRSSFATLAAFACLSIASSGACANTLDPANAPSIERSEPVENIVPETRVVQETLVVSPGAELPGLSAINYARIGAVADSLSTHIALGAGAVEKNALINTSPAGLIALTVIKLGVLEYADRLPENERALALKLSAALWAGISVNNLMVAAAVGGAAPFVVGAAVGYVVWEQTASRLAAEKLLKASVPVPF
jgi:hypothetical protein